MSESLLKRAEEIFLELADLPREQWESRLHERCAGDRELMREVSSLLDCHEKAETFLDAAELVHLRPFGAALADEELPAGARVDEFVVVRFLGRGGMGNVYVAEQDRPRRTVALKVIRRGFATAALLRRFEHEAEFLGKLHHPGIAQIYAAGTAVVKGADGAPGPSQPFIAMELVNGPPLNTYAKEKGLKARDSMEIVARVCDAVHHAHQRGVIHRDLKPANILVDEGGQPRILDFGVARAADSDLDVQTMQTRVGQIIGTLPYMSPEQVVGDADDVDTRSDVYALGVILYQLLSGKLPLDVSDRSIAEAARIIRDESPLKLGQIDRSMRGDIETIAGKALEKDPTRRYQSAAEFGEDLRRYISGRPVQARQDSALYVIRKQINRNKGSVAAGAVLMLGILVFAVYASHEAGKYEDLAIAEKQAKGRAEAARDEAFSERRRADEVAGALEKELSASNIERGRLLARSGNLAGAEDLLWTEHLKNLESYHTFYALWELYSRVRCEATLLVNTPRATRMRLSPDGKLVATAGLNPPVLVQDTRTLERVSAFGVEGVEHSALAFAPSGLLATADVNGRISIWDAKAGREVVRLREAGAGVVDMVFDRTGTRLAVGFSDSSLVVLDARPEEVAERVLARRDGMQVRTLAYDPAGSNLLVGRPDAKVWIVGGDTLKTLHEFSNPDDWFPKVAYSPDGSLVAAGGSSRLTRVWRVSDGEQIASLYAPNGNIQAVSFTPDGKKLLAVGWWNVHVWDIATQKVVDAFSGYRASAIDICVSADGKQAWTNLGTTLRAWDLDPMSGRRRIEPSTVRTLVSFSPTGELICAEADGSVTLATDPEGAYLATLGRGAKRVRAVTVSKARPIAAAASVDGWVGLFDLKTRSLLCQWQGFKMPTNDGMSFDSKGERLIVPGADDSFRVLQVPDGEVVLTIPRDGSEALCGVFSPDDRLIATTTRRGYVCIYDAVTGVRLRECAPAQPTVPWIVRFTPDGKSVLAGNWSRSIDVWSVDSGKLLRTLEGHRGLVTDLEFRPKEPNILASSGADGEVMLWDLSLPHQTPVLTLDALDGWEAWAIDFDSKGRRLAATNSMGTTVIWDLRHFNRHIGGNMQAWIEQNRSSLGKGFDEQRAEDQRKLLLNRGRGGEAVQGAVVEDADE